MTSQVEEEEEEFIIGCPGDIPSSPFSDSLSSQSVSQSSTGAGEPFLSTMCINFTPDLARLISSRVSPPSPNPSDSVPPVDCHYYNLPPGTGIRPSRIEHLPPHTRYYDDDDDLHHHQIHLFSNRRWSRFKGQRKRKEE